MWKCVYFLRGRINVHVSDSVTEKERAPHISAFYKHIAAEQKLVTQMQCIAPDVCHHPSVLTELGIC